jgi:hypothetical protein
MRNTENHILFRNSIRRGTGKAYLLATRHHDCDFTDEIISACVKNYAYDGQCESSRAFYLYQIIQVHGDKNRIKKAILKAINDEVKDTWTLTQLFSLAFLFAKEGDCRFKEAIYQRFYKNTIEGSDWVGYEEIIEFDGFSGLQHIANVMGQGMIDDPAKWHDDMIILHFSEKYPEINARAELEKCAVSSPQIARYLSGIDEVEKTRSESRVAPENYSSLLEEIRNRRVLYSLRKRAVTEEELLTVANALIVEDDLRHIEKLLNFFGYFKFPLDSNVILKHARRKKNQKDAIVARAIDALKLIASDAVRDFALDRLVNSRNPEKYVGLLICNYKEGDSVLLSQIASHAKSYYVIEGLAQDYSSIYENNLTKESFQPLDLIYNKMTCSYCRECIIKAMVKNDVVPAEVFEELQYDCNEEIRKIASACSGVHCRTKDSEPSFNVGIVK